MNRAEPSVLDIRKDRNSETICCSWRIPCFSRLAITRSIKGDGGVFWKTHGPPTGGGRAAPCWSKECSQ
jgi:hypothetical protein